MSRIRLGLVAATAAAAVGGGTAVASFGATTVAKPTKPTVITVKASEFKFVLSKRSLAKPGRVTFKVKNVGKEAHNFVILSGINKATALIAPRKTRSLTVTFKKKGHYTYECTVGEHAEEGMLGSFVVR